jgi:hypothetical protein
VLLPLANRLNCDTRDSNGSRADGFYSKRSFALIILDADQSRVEEI